MDFGTMLIWVVAYFGLFTATFFLLTLFENLTRLKNPTPPQRLPSVTVVVPAYNEELTIEKTVRSLLSLDYPRKLLKIIVIDDGSTDRTFEIARRFEAQGVEVFTKKNAGKAAALNFAIRKSDTELFGALDADSFVQPDALRKMVGYFKDCKVMAVTPSLKVYQPISTLQKIQYIEYLIGIFLRKVFAWLDSIHVTPGPFTIYRKKFFDKHGGYDENNLTEDIEVALRIQEHHYRIENSADATVYTVSPSRFGPLLKQRMRWYIGFTENVARYRKIFSRKYGDLGMFILPASFISVSLVIVTMFYTIFRIVESTIKKYNNWKAVNYEFWKLRWWNTDLFYINIDALLIFSLIALILGISIIYIAKRMSHEQTRIKTFYVFYLMVYWMLFGFWWLASGAFSVLGKKVSWGQKNFKHG
jgi:cellulose synthase/poly-beta-1,6-N-acetylglucosamine synthase-like glycosyltransferase